MQYVLQCASESSRNIVHALIWGLCLGESDTEGFRDRPGFCKLPGVIDTLDTGSPIWGSRKYVLNLGEQGSPLHRMLSLSQGSGCALHKAVPSGQGCGITIPWICTHLIPFSHQIVLGSVRQGPRTINQILVSPRMVVLAGHYGQSNLLSPKTKPQDTKVQMQIDRSHLQLTEDKV